MVVMGIDGGASHVRVALADADLNVLGQGDSGGVNPNVQSPEVAEAHLRTAIQQALKTATLTPDQIEAVCLGIAGTSYEHRRGDWLRRTLANLLSGVRVVSSSDAEIALVGALGSPCGVIVMAGTGSVAWGIDRQGRRARAGGYGYLLGDEGSGYWLGKEALAAGLQAHFEQSASTRLTERLLTHFQMDTPDLLIEWVYTGGALKNTTIAALAPLVLQAAEEGDPAAQAIVERGAEALSGLAKSILRQLNDPALPIAFSGSVLNESPVMSRRLCRFLELTAIPVPRYPPVLGAVLLAQFSSEKSHTKKGLHANE